MPPPPTMAYSDKIIAEIKKQPMSNLGARLGRWAVFHDLPVTKLALVTGATRQSVYNWFRGGEVFVAYRPRVLDVIKILESVKDADSDRAWRELCKAFDLNN